MDTEAEKYLVPDSDTRTRKSHAFKYRIPRISNDVLKFSFFLGPNQCERNSSPSEIANSGSLQSLKIKLADYFNMFK